MNLYVTKSSAQVSVPPTSTFLPNACAFLALLVSQDFHFLSGHFHLLINVKR